MTLCAPLLSDGISFHRMNRLESKRISTFLSTESRRTLIRCADGGVWPSTWPLRRDNLQILQNSETRMESRIEYGFLYLVVAGLMNASFTLPMKFTRSWAWENTWLAWTSFALVILPAATALCTIPALVTVYHLAGAKLFSHVLAFGAIWGLSQVFFGIAVETIGIALTFSIVLGVSAATGTLIPMLLLHPEKLDTTAGHTLLVGIVLMLLGVSICAVAGRLRENAASACSGRQRKNIEAGLTLAILCGCAASFQNFALAFGTPLVSLAIQHGARPSSAANVIWLPLLIAGSIPSLLYCLWLMRKRSTAANFLLGGVDHWILALVMGCLWFGSLLLYGASVSSLGSLGAAIGWPLFMSLIVIAASLLGAATGEWKRSGRWPIMIQLGGVAELTLAIFILAKASQAFA